MKLTGTLRYNENGILEIGECCVTDLVQKHGTPLYIIDEKTVRNKCRAYHNALKENYPHYKILYASKAFCCMGICRLMEQEGLGLDVVSGGELYTALAANFNPRNIYFHGNNKSREELSQALEARVGAIVIDNLWELDLLVELIAASDDLVDVMLRITPGVEAHTHHYIQTGQEDSKFGISLEDGVALHAAKRILDEKNLNLKGIHCHIGSQIFNLEAYRVAAKRMLEFMAEVKNETGLLLKELNMGGGLGICYTEEDPCVTIENYIGKLCDSVKTYCEEFNLPLPTLLIEPGRSLVGDTGIAVYRVGAIKEIPGIRTYASVDGGMSDNPRPALYGAEYEAILVENNLAESNMEYTIAGKCCESGDVLINNITLPKLKSGELIAILSSGAYHYAMANNYNKIPRPTVISAADGQEHTIIRRETYNDLIKYDKIPTGWTKNKDKIAAV